MSATVLISAAYQPSKAMFRLGDWASEELIPIEALRIYLETKSISRERQEVLLEYGERLIREA